MDRQTHGHTALKTIPALQNTAGMHVNTDKTVEVILPLLIVRDHSFPRQILANSAAQFAKFRGKFLEFRGSPRPPTLESLCRL